MKKLLSFLLVTAIISGLVACNTSSSTSDSEDTEWGDFTVGENDPKAITEQRREIKEAMNLAMNTEVVWEEIPAFDPSVPQYAHISAITFDGLESQGQKTKVFAYIGFPEGATSESPVPAVVLLHGLGGHPILEWVRLWNERGYAAISVGTNGSFPTTRNDGMTEGQGVRFPNGMTGIFMEDGYVNVPPHGYPTEYAEVDEQWPYHGLSQAILAGNLLRQDPRVDDNKVGIHGISWGGMMTSQIIGYDNRFAFAIPVYGTAYLGDEARPAFDFSNEYVDALWAAERNLDNAKMPIFWFAYTDDNNFGINAYVKSYSHTESFNEKNTLLMLSEWSHSHTAVLNRTECFDFADWALGRGGGFVTVETQPSGRDVNFQISIPAEITGDITATVYYIDEPMTYSTYNKYGWGEYLFMDQSWQSDSECLTVDKATGTVSGRIPEAAKGYYINVFYNIGESLTQTSSVYVTVE